MLEGQRRQRRKWLFFSWDRLKRKLFSVSAVGQKFSFLYDYPLGWTGVPTFRSLPNSSNLRLPYVFPSFLQGKNRHFDPYDPKHGLKLLFVMIALVHPQQWIRGVSLQACHVGFLIVLFGYVHANSLSSLKEGHWCSAWASVKLIVVYTCRRACCVWGEVRFLLIDSPTIAWLVGVKH